jgi:hypothetical protein
MGMPTTNDTGLFKRVSFNMDRADYDWLQENLDEAKRLGVVPSRTTVTDILNEGLKLRLGQIKADLAAGKKRPKK